MDNTVSIMEQYDANDLLIFARVVEAGSFSRAAEKIGLPKSTVSRRIANLEERMGERLLQRTTRRLHVTEFGEHLLEHARQVADEMDAVIALVEHRQAQPSGLLRVSMPTDFASQLLTEMLQAFATLHPAVSLELDLSQRRVDIVGENFDLAVRMGNLPDDNLLAARRIATFAIGLYAAPAYLMAHGTPATPADLEGHETLSLPGAADRKSCWQLSNGKEQVNFVASGRFFANSPQLLINLACSGAGITAVPIYFAKPYVQRGELRPVLPEWTLPPHSAWAVFPGRRLMPAKTRAFIEMLETALAGASTTGPAGYEAWPKPGFRRSRPFQPLL